jgi:FtsP/CotA-like multicopper oxidase with cupredoxin domain
MAPAQELSVGTVRQALRGTDHAPSDIGAFAGLSPGPALRLQRSVALTVQIRNRLAFPVGLAWPGNSGPAGEPPFRVIAPGAEAALPVTPRHAGTFLFHARMLEADAPLPLPAAALIVDESARPDSAREALLLIEEWRVNADGRALPPGQAAPDGAQTLFTANGMAMADIPVQPGDRLRLRLVNGAARARVAVRVADHEVRVMALDGQPSEPFLARDGRVILAPGNRADVLIDATGAPGTMAAIHLHDGIAMRVIARLRYADIAARAVRSEPPPPLPDNGLPARLDLKNAVRIDLPLAGLAAADSAAFGWSAPAAWAGQEPAFRVKRGRVVVLALTNPHATPAVFHLHGHHFRLLDRLDDGWKPFWLDTLALEAGQSARIAFAPDTPGAWRLESMAAVWSAPRHGRLFVVE